LILSPPASPRYASSHQCTQSAAGTIISIQAADFGGNAIQKASLNGRARRNEPARHRLDLNCHRLRPAMKLLWRLLVVVYLWTQRDYQSLLRSINRRGIWT
jgi:hypothetical protein